MEWKRNAEVIFLRNFICQIFQKGIHPDWADFQNKYGGRWVIEWKEQDLRCKDDVDSHWMEILFILIGEHGDPYNDIVNGAVIQVKKNKFRIGVWLKVGLFFKIMPGQS